MTGLGYSICGLLVLLGLIFDRTGEIGMAGAAWLLALVLFIAVLGSTTPAAQGEG